MWFQDSQMTISLTHYSPIKPVARKYFTTARITGMLRDSNEMRLVKKN
jgi:hypothetical protein